MAGIESFLKKVCVQTAVYWGQPQEDGFGGKVHATPREIKCRWSIETTIIKTGDGKETISDSGILVLEDLSEQGLLYLGFLTDLTPVQKKNPLSIPEIKEIKAFDKIPMIKSTKVFVRKVYLSGLSRMNKSF